MRTLRLRFLCASFVGASCVAACRPQSQSGISPARNWSPAQLLGCYEILDSTRHRADSAWYNVMGLVRLTDVPMREFAGTSTRRAWHLRPLSDSRNGHWKADPSGAMEHANEMAPLWFLNSSGDVAIFAFGDGFSGAGIRFFASDARGDTLRGRVTEYWDYGPFKNDRGVAYAVRRVCPDT
jgi:hypothetical protein